MVRFAEIFDMDALLDLDKHISSNELKYVVERRRVLIAGSDKKIVGLLRFGLFWDNLPFMNMLYIAEGERSKGYGSELCSRWESEMTTRGFDIVLTSTLSNENAQQFYRKHGYKDCGSLILPGEPLEIILMKELKKTGK